MRERYIYYRQHLNFMRVKLIIGQPVNLLAIKREHSPYNRPKAKEGFLATYITWWPFPELGWPELAGTKLAAAAGFGGFAGARTS